MQGDDDDFMWPNDRGVADGPVEISQFRLLDLQSVKPRLKSKALRRYADRLGQDERSSDMVDQTIIVCECGVFGKEGRIVSRRTGLDKNGHTDMSR